MKIPLSRLITRSLVPVSLLLLVLCFDAQVVGFAQAQSGHPARKSWGYSKWRSSKWKPWKKPASTTPAPTPAPAATATPATPATTSTAVTTPPVAQPPVTATPSPVVTKTDVPQPEAATTNVKSAADDRLSFLSESKGEPSASEPPSALAMAGRALGALLVVLGVLVFGAWGVRKFSGQGTRFPTIGKDEVFQVIKTVSLGDRRSLMVVKFQNRLLLLGATQQAITLLSTEGDGSPAAPEKLIDARSVSDLLGGNRNEEFERELLQFFKN